MKTETIYRAMYLVHWRCLPGGSRYPRAERQHEKFRDAFYKRMEAGDKARAIVAEIAEVNKYEHDNDDLAIAVAGIINKHCDWLDELPT